MNMVRNAYKPVYRPQSVTFGQLSDSPYGPLQKVFLVGPDGKSYVAVYSLQRQPDGTWRINGCTLVEDTALRAAMAERARRRAEMFSWESYRQRLAALLGDLAVAEPSERPVVLRAHQERMQRVIQGRTDEPRTIPAAPTPS